jgi:hypothetical protein
VPGRVAPHLPRRRSGRERDAESVGEAQGYRHRGHHPGPLGRPAGRLVTTLARQRPETQETRPRCGFSQHPTPTAEGALTAGPLAASPIVQEAPAPVLVTCGRRPTRSLADTRARLWGGLESPGPPCAREREHSVMADARRSYTFSHRKKSPRKLSSHLPGTSEILLRDHRNVSWTCVVTLLKYLLDVCPRNYCACGDNFVTLSGQWPAECTGQGDNYLAAFLYPFP